MFEVGDKVFHPESGAGVVKGTKRIPALGDDANYYRIHIMSNTKTVLLIPVKDVKTIGMRFAINKAQLEQLWALLSGEPESLPPNKKTRKKTLKEMLDTGDPFEIAKIIRDLTGRKRNEEKMYANDRKTMKKAMKLLSAEIAVVQDIDFNTAEQQIHAALEGKLSLQPVI